MPLDVSPVVASVSPNLYVAAKSANLSQAQNNQLTQMSYGLTEHKKLMNMADKDAARKQFQALDKSAQQTLTFLYKDAPYAQGDPAFLQGVGGTLKHIAGVAASPIVQTFKALGEWTKALHTPYLVARQVAQGASVFDVNVWKNGYDGNKVYDDKALADAITAHSAIEVEVARGLIAGRTPGQIIQDHGKVDQQITTAVASAFTDKEKWKVIMQDVKFAQVSPGRDIARTFLGARSVKYDGLHGSYVSGAERFLSGAIDMAYTIAFDPLTWATGGGTKAANLGERLARNLENEFKANIAGGLSPELSIAVPMRKLFQNRKVATLWDNQLGPLIKQYAEAPDSAAKDQVWRKIAHDHSGMANPDTINMLAKENVFTAGKAEEFFTEMENVPLLLSGGVTGMTTYRAGVPLARRNIFIKDKLSEVLDSVFNSTTTKKLGNMTIHGRDGLLAERAGYEFKNALMKPGVTAVDGFVNPAPEMALFQAYAASQKGLKRIGQLATRHPNGLAVFIDDKHVAKTANNLTLQLRMIMPRDAAGFITQEFIHNMTPADRVVLKRNLDSAIMDTLGIAGNSNYEIMKETVLRQKYGGKAGFGTTPDVAVANRLTEHMFPGSLRNQEGTNFLQSGDPFHPSDFATQIGSLDYRLILKTAIEVKSKQNLMGAMKGTFTGQLASNLTDVWSILTLLPRLGIRSSIDELMMFALTAPASDLLAFVKGTGYKAGHAMTQFTGSDAAIGLGRDWFSHIPALKRLKIQDSVSIEARQQALRDLAKKLEIEVEQLTQVQLRNEVANLCDLLWTSKLTVKEKKFFHDAMVHHTTMFDATVRSMVGSSSLNGSVTKEIHRAMISPSALDLSGEELGAIQTGNFKIRNIKDIFASGEKTELGGDLYVAHAQFAQWFPMFVANKIVLEGEAAGKKVNRLIEPSHVFLSNYAMKEGIAPNGKTHVQNAIEQYMAQIGVEWDKALGKYVVVDEKAVNEFLGMSARTITMEELNASKAEMVWDQASRTMADMYTTFHGSSEGFNQELLTTLQKARNKLNEMPGNEFQASWSQAAATINVKDFARVTKDHRITGNINSDIEFAGEADPISAWKRWGDYWMEGMDKQITGIFRQPAMMITYIRIRSAYEGLEMATAQRLGNQMVRDAIEAQTKLGKVSEIQLTKMSAKAENSDHFQAMVNKAMENIRGKKLSPKYEGILRKRAEDQTAAKFTNIAMEEAGHQVLKFSDNPAIRSNFAYMNRTTARYYRATEDFQRRVYRMKDMKLRALFRLRLASIGINAYGDTFTDANGEAYVMMPMDNIIFKATDTTLRALTGGIGYHQPQFDNINFKLRMMNPSFQQDSGLPVLSGPIASLSVLTAQSVLGHVDAIPFIGNHISGKAAALAHTIGSVALGSSMSENISVANAILPAGLMHVWGLLPVNEQSRQEVTAAQQAMAFNAANGKPGSSFLDPNSTPEQKAAYLKNIRISAHNIIFMRNMLSLVMPATPTLTASVDVPNYLKKVGITALRPEFFDVLTGVMKSSNPSQDPYGEALAVFTMKNPGRLVYTTSPDSKQTRVVVRTTQELKGWAANNSDLIKTYGEVAFIFAPQTGKFNAGSYNWLKAAGLIKSDSLEKYYDNLLVSTDKQKYYDIATQETQQLERVSDPASRAAIIKGATDARAMLKMANPLLMPALGGSTIGLESTLLTSLSSLVDNKSTNIPDGTRLRMSQAINLMNDFVQFATNSDNKQLNNFVELKKQRKAEIESSLLDLMSGDLYITEANRAIFKGILSYYSRDTYVIGKAQW